MAFILLVLSCMSLSVFVDDTLTCSVDEGAYRAITNKESGGRLLPAGVIRVEGVFASHQGVRIVVRRRRKTTKHQKSLTDQYIDENTATTSDQPSSLASPALKHLQPPIAHASTSSPASPETHPEPSTPLIHPAASMSSSVASLEPLSRSVPPSPAVKAITERLSATNINSSLGQELKAVQESQTAADTKEAQRLLDMGDEWEEVEIGKGLSHYNSVEIDRIKGIKR
jgi:glutamate 5-kinase